MHHAWCETGLLRPSLNHPTLTRRLSDSSDPRPSCDRFRLHQQQLRSRSGSGRPRHNTSPGARRWNPGRSHLPRRSRRASRARRETHRIDPPTVVQRRGERQRSRVFRRSGLRRGPVHAPVTRSLVHRSAGGRGVRVGAPECAARGGRGLCRRQRPACYWRHRRA